MSGVQDDLGGPIVLLEEDDARAGEVVFHIQEHAGIGAAPAIDGLVIVGHSAQIAVAGSLGGAAGEQAHEVVLRLVRVLELVHMDIFVTALVLTQNARIADPELVGEQDEIVEVDRVVLAQQGLVTDVDARRHFLEVFAGALLELDG